MDICRRLEGRICRTKRKRVSCITHTLTLHVITLHTMTKQWRYVNFFLTYLHFQRNEYIFDEINSTIVFLVDNSDNCHNEKSM